MSKKSEKGDPEITLSESGDEKKPQTDSVYTDERFFDLTPSGEEQLHHYVQQLENLSTVIRYKTNSKTSFPWQEWENGLRQFYKEMVHSAFKQLEIPRVEGLEIYFAGSLAKAQATEYSDLDAFVIVNNEEDIKKVQLIFNAVNNLCQRLYAKNRQLYPDPIGINPGRLMGTPDSLFEKLKTGDVTNPEATVISILTSKPILGEYKLGEQLRTKIQADPELRTFTSAKKFYDLAVTEFSAPKADAEVIDIKSHIMRPVDFVLMGLREEFDLYSEDGSHLSAPGTIRLLRERKSIPEEQIALIESVYNEAMQTRFALHADHGKEHDKLPVTEAKEMLDRVAQIREFGASRIKQIETRANPIEIQEKQAKVEKLFGSQGLSRHLFYDYATKGKGRDHKEYTATTDNFRDLKNKYNELCGDALKTKILCDFKVKLGEATDQDSLENIVNELKNSEEYKVLEIGQGYVTRTFGLKTSSVEAFELMVEAAEIKINSSFTNNM